MVPTDDHLLQKHRALILAATGDGVYGLDVDGITTFANPAAERLTGFSLEEMLGKEQHELIHHSHADGTHFPKNACHILSTIQDGKVCRVSDQIFFRKDGTSFPVEYVSTPILDEGEIVGAVISFRDITERKQTEEALLESEERYRKIVESTHEAIFLVRVVDGVMLDVNEEACRMLGYSRDVLVTKTAEDLHQHQMDIHREVIKSLLESGKVKTDRLSCLASSGEQIPVRVSASVIQLQGRECILFIAQDMRAYVEAERQAKKLQADLHHGSRVSAMGEMASGMAHELNQPLTAVMNYLQACQMIFDSGSKDTQDKVSVYLSKAIDQAARAGKIISGLRSFVQKKETDRSLEDLNEIVTEASGLLLSTATAEGTDFKFELAKDLPHICVDKIQIQQVVFNLVRNGLEALSKTEKGQLKIVTTPGGNNSVRISVCDNGHGVDDELLAKLFDAFTTTKADGMGVGLSISKSIVEDHGGEIRADRNTDGGMTFTFTLPGAAEGDASV